MSSQPVTIVSMYLDNSTSPARISCSGLKSYTDCRVRLTLLVLTKLQITSYIALYNALVTHFVTSYSPTTILTTNDLHLSKLHLILTDSYVLTYLEIGGCHLKQCQIPHPSSMPTSNSTSRINQAKKNPQILPNIPYPFASSTPRAKARLNRSTARGIKKKP